MTIRSTLLMTIHKFDNLRDQLKWAAPLLARFTLGVLFLSTGWGKVHHLEKVTAFFADLAIPYPALQATLVSYVELIGGSLLIIGLATEFAAVPLIVSMSVALLTAKRGEIHNLPDLFGLVEWTYLMLLIWIVFVGAGRISVDSLLRRLIRGRNRHTTAPLFDASNQAQST